MTIRQGWMAAAVVSAAVVLGGCVGSPATTEQYEKLLEAWIGHQESLLVRVWGKPSQSRFLTPREKPAGGKELAYYNPGIYSWCMTRFTLDKANIVRRWRHEGSGCKTYRPDAACKDATQTGHRMGLPWLAYPCPSPVRAPAKPS